MTRSIRIEELPDGQFLAIDGIGQGFRGSTPTAAYEAARAGLEPIPGVIYPTAERDIMAYAGIFKDNPMFDEWVEAIAENRRIQDEEEARRDAEIETSRERSVR
jgi:hypothetical protein